VPQDLRDLEAALEDTPTPNTAVLYAAYARALAHQPAGERNLRQALERHLLPAEAVNPGNMHLEYHMAEVCVRSAGKREAVDRREA